MFLAGCAASADAPPRSTTIHGVTPGHKCETGDTDQFLGQATDGESGPAILRVTKAAALRWAPPGVMLTMDFREDRVTVRLGPDGKITAIKCG
jgi:hypothetical protein